MRTRRTKTTKSIDPIKLNRYITSIHFKWFVATFVSFLIGIILGLMIGVGVRFR